MEKITIFEQYEQIKDYLIGQGINVDNVIRWQGGFIHVGTSYGLEVIATIEINGNEERYCIPKYVIKNPTPNGKILLKLGDQLNR